ncbi:hypothetical protein KY327_02510 [Candidatus Woesearchaeota archaeon]|nr:hypothetical protein [Candidatus Woesearchaeota archaeon]
MPADILKRGQLQIGESIIVIVLILIILVIALVFSARMGAEKYKVQLQGFRQGDAIETAQTVTNLFELKCDKEGLKTTCVDKHKALAFANLLEDNETARAYYSQIFPESRIVIKQVYPPGQNMTIYEENASDDGQTSQPFLIPVSIHNASADTMAFGILQIQQYDKEVGT